MVRHSTNTHTHTRTEFEFSPRLIIYCIHTWTTDSTVSSAAHIPYEHHTSFHVQCNCMHSYRARVYCYKTSTTCMRVLIIIITDDDDPAFRKFSMSSHCCFQSVGIKTGFFSHLFCLKAERIYTIRPHMHMQEMMEQRQRG